jgi:membrane fusion protein (multidrug efflux system)
MDCTPITAGVSPTRDPLLRYREANRKHLQVTPLVRADSQVSNPSVRDLKVKPQNGDDQVDRPPDAGGQNGKDDGGASKPPGKPLLWRYPWATVAVLIAIVALGVGAYFYWQYARQFEETDDAFIDSRTFGIAVRVSGDIDDVPVTDNQHIKAGATILRIDQRDYIVAAELAQAQVQSAQASIENYDAQLVAQGSQIEQAAAQVQLAEAAQRFAVADSDRYQELAQKGSGTVQRSQQATSDMQQRVADSVHAKAAFAGATQQVRVLAAQKKGAIASLSQASAQLDQASLNLSYTTVISAQAGRITKLSAAVGQYVQPGTTVAMFVPDQIWITANFKETQLTDMRPGQSVRLTIDAYPAHSIRGRVESIQSGSGTAFSLLPAENATGNYVKVVQRIPVKIVVDDWPPDVTIGPGMSVTPRVRVLDAKTGKIASPLALGRSALAWLGWWPAYSVVG